MLCRDGPKGNKFADAGVGENDIDSPLHLSDRLVKTIKVGQLGSVSLNSINVATDCLHGLVEFLLSTARDEDIGALFDEKLRRSKSNPFCPAGDDGGPAFELFGHCFSSLLLVPSIGKYHRCPAIAAPLFAQATQGRKIHMRPRDQNILARELRQQLIPRRRSRSLVDVKYRGDLGMRQLDAQCMDDVAPKQDFLSLGRKLIAGMSRGMTRQRDDLHAVDDWLGAIERVPLAGLDVRSRDGLRTRKERLRILRRLSSDFRRQPKVAFCLRDVNIGIWKDALSFLSGQTADVIGMEVCDQNDVDFFRCVACAAEAASQAPQCSPTPPGASTRIDEN